jgi:SAM-dependent methyltransferase
MKNRYSLFHLIVYRIFSRAHFFYFLKFYRELFLLIKNVRARNVLTKTQMDSFKSYENHGFADHEAYENNSYYYVMFKNKVTKMGSIQVRQIYIDPIKIQIRNLLKIKSQINILEVGSGNCINLYLLKKEFKDQVNLTGIDISPTRIKVAKDYFGEGLNGVTLIAEDITSQELFDNQSFDLVFTMHCLEQITYNGKNTISEILRLTKYKTILIEPIYELANSSQKLYLINADHNRVILKDLKNLLETSSFSDMSITELSPLEISSNPSNPSAIVLIDRQ